jgi:peroxiredoxin
VASLLAAGAPVWALAPAGAQDEQSPLIGKPAPEIRVKDFVGKDHSLAEYKGKIILLAFTASWSPPCNAEVISLEQGWQQIPKESMVVVGVATAENGDPVKASRAFRDRHRLTYPFWIDTDSKARAAYDVRTLPTNVIIDPQGVVRYYRTGFDGLGIDKELKQLRQAPARSGG